MGAVFLKAKVRFQGETVIDLTYSLGSPHFFGEIETNICLKFLVTFMVANKEDITV